MATSGPTQPGADPSPRGGDASATWPVGAPSGASTLPGDGPAAFAADGPPEFPGYEILGEAGRGGMGVVYRARQVSLGRTVALKAVLAGGLASPETLARFRAEAEALAGIDHPNIIKIFDSGSHRGTPFFVMEYCPGGSLAGGMQGVPQPPRAVAETVERLARAIAAAHAAGIVHRDLKPSNVLVAGDGTLKVADFGLAKRDDVAMTASGALLGTPSYMAPEQAEGDARRIGPAADVYALGALMYEMLSGRPPLKGVSALETLRLVREVEPVAVRLLQPSVPRDLETICAKCLQKAPSRRYPGASGLADDLGRFLDGRPISARPIGRLERARRWCGRNPSTAGLIAALSLTLLIGCAAVLWFAMEADSSARAARLALREKEAAVRKERETARRFVIFLSSNRDAWNLPARQLVERFLAASPDLSPEDLDRAFDPSPAAGLGGFSDKDNVILNMLGD